MTAPAGARFDVDVAVVGGGPGGSAAARALARKGRSVVLFERDPFPRFHIGESLLPWSHGVFKELGFETDIDAQGFMPKWGATFLSADGTLDSYADFASAVEVERAQTWQVRRSTFDGYVLDQARKAGVDVRMGVAVTDVAFDRDGATIAHHAADGAAGTTRARFVVDASGRRGLIVTKHGKRVMEPLLDNISVHAQYEGVPRREGRRAGDIRILTRRDAGWVWMIPLCEKVMSVGVVLPKKLHAASGRPMPLEALEHYLGEMPVAVDLMKDAKRVTEARFDADYSYLATQHAGDGWVAVGDAGAFLDPVFSTGVLLAMQGGLDAAKAIDDALMAGDTSRARFARFERLVIRRYRHFRRFAVGFYTPEFRALFFQRERRIGTYEAVVSMLAGNWRPTLPTRLRVELFFALVALQRRFRFVDETALRPVAA